jgi:hypothetical protein
MKTTKEKKYTKEEIHKLLDSVDAYKYLSWGELLRIALWEQFSRWRIQKFYISLDNGMSAKAAYRVAKNATK